MTNGVAKITLAEAFAIARNAAKSILRGLADESTPLLDESRYLEAPGCWMLFRNPAIVIPESRILSDCAFVVSKHGDFRSVPDFSDEPQKLGEYLAFVSSYFVKHENKSV